MIKLSKPYIPQSAIREVVKVLESGNLVQGEYVLRFEKEICGYLNAGNAVAVSNGTAALHLSLMALGIKAGDEVIVPAFTYPATANVVEVSGARPVPVDITNDTFCIDISKIEKAISPRTKAIIPVHEFGQMAEIKGIMELAKKHNLFVIEDAACALGSEYLGQKAGSFGHAGCFSFHPRKAITTGEGGVIVTNNNELAEKLRILRNHGTVPAGQRKYDFAYAGLNYRMTDFQAALGLGQLEEIEKLIEQRIDIAGMYDAHLSGVEWLKVPQHFNDRRMIYQTYHVMIDEEASRDALIDYLRDNGIESNIGAYALNCLKYYRDKYGFDDASMPKAKEAYRRGIALPMSNYISREDVLYISGKIKSFNS